jgi:hypothetical protein
MTGRSQNRFNKRELTRAIQGTEDSGRAVDRVEVDPKSGKITVFLRGATDSDPPENLMDKL